MNKIILIKYGELTTKKSNINYFIKTLKNNIMISLDNKCKIVYDKGRMFISECNIDDTLNILKNVSGIHEYGVCYYYDDNDIESIKNNILDLIKDINFNTFKVVTKRSYKEYKLDSMEINNIIGGVILSNIDNIKVDVHNPELVIHIEIRKDAYLIYFNLYKGIGGFPLGVSGKGLLMLSGGIDSPVAGYLTIKKGVKLEAIYFESPPHTSIDALNKVKELSRKLAVYNHNIRLYVVNFTKIQEEIYRNINHEYMVTIMRRMMYRISERIAIKNKDIILVNGESIGQVASQTLNSMNVINNVVNIPVIRPLITTDKNDIINIAKDINTYDVSILPYEDCCTIFVPLHPVINPTLDKCEYYESLYNFDELIDDAVASVDIINIKTNDDRFNNIL